MPQRQNEAINVQGRATSVPAQQRDPSTGSGTGAASGADEVVDIAGGEVAFAQLVLSQPTQPGTQRVLDAREQECLRGYYRFMRG
jgi:hypothetical protein